MWPSQGQYTCLSPSFDPSVQLRGSLSAKLLATDSSFSLPILSILFPFWHMTMHSCWITTTAGFTVQSFVTSLGIMLWLHWLQTSKTVLFLWLVVNSILQSHVHKFQATIRLTIFSTGYTCWSRSKSTDFSFDPDTDVATLLDFVFSSMYSSVTSLESLGHWLSGSHRSQSQ